MAQPMARRSHNFTIFRLWPWNPVRTRVPWVTVNAALREMDLLGLCKLFRLTDGF